MRISDWSSDVCSSDLVAAIERSGIARGEQEHLAWLEPATARPGREWTAGAVMHARPCHRTTVDAHHSVAHAHALRRDRTEALEEWHRPGQVTASSKESRVGERGARKRYSRGGPEH